MSITVSHDLHLLGQHSDALLARLDDATEMYDAIGQEMESRILGRFETQTDPDGAAWHPWAQATIDHYPDDGHRKLLDRYGDMLRSVSHQAEKNRAIIGFGMPYETYHEWGTEIMPRRGLMTSDPETGELGQGDIDSILEIVSVFFDV